MKPAQSMNTILTGSDRVGVYHLLVRFARPGLASSFRAEERFTSAAWLIQPLSVSSSFRRAAFPGQTESRVRWCAVISFAVLPGCLCVYQLSFPHQPETVLTRR